MYEVYVRKNTLFIIMCGLIHTAVNESVYNMQL